MINWELVFIVAGFMIALASLSIGLISAAVFAKQAYKHAKETIAANLVGERLTYEEDNYDCQTFILMLITSIWFFALAIFGLLLFILMGVVYL